MPTYLAYTNSKKNIYGDKTNKTKTNR